MKYFFTFILSLVFIQTINSQRNIWQFDFSTDTVYVRTDTSCVIRKATIDIPGHGLVILKMDGVVSGSPGDVITMGVSNTNNWVSNHGNTGYRFPDSLHNQQQFTHGIAFRVEPGLQDFYAVMQNWTDKYGSGYASANGKMTVEYIPYELPGLNSGFQYINKYPIVLTEEWHIIDSVRITSENAQSYLLSSFLTTYSSNHQNLEVSLQFTDDTGTHLVVIPSPIVYTNDYRHFNSDVFAAFSPGEHTIYLAARKISGNFTSGNNAFYGTICASPMTNNNESMLHYFDSFSKNINIVSQGIEVRNFEWEMPEDGKLYLYSDGYWNGKIGDDVIMELKWSHDENESASSHSFSVDQEESLTHYSLQQVINVTKGQVLPLSLEATFFGQLSPTGQNLITGKIKGYLISKLTTTGIDEEIPVQFVGNIYPNPSTEKLVVEANLPACENYSFMIIDNSGEIVFQKNDCTSATWSLATDVIKSGVYTVIFKTHRQHLSRKLVVLH